MSFVNLAISLTAILSVMAAHIALTYLPPGLYTVGLVRLVAKVFVLAQAGFAVHMAYIAVKGDLFVGDLLPVLYVAGLTLLVIAHSGRIRYYAAFMGTFGRTQECSVDAVVEVMRLYTRFYPDMLLYVARGPVTGLIALKVGKKADKVVAQIMLSSGRHIELFDRLATDFIGTYYRFQHGSPTQLALSYHRVEGIWLLEDASTGPITARRRFLDEAD